MITIKSDREIALMKEAGRITAYAHEQVRKAIRPGISTYELDKIAYNAIISCGATPSFLNYQGYPASICTSVNEVVIHGIPSKRKLRNGDIISIDIGACYKGYHGDSAWTFAVGEISPKKRELMEHTKESLFKGLEQIKPGNHIGDISHAIEEYANKYHLGVIRELVGHGVGTSVHEAPDVPNYGPAGVGPILKEGMVLAIEPMLSLGRRDICILDDDWTIETVDNSPAAHYEHTVVVTHDGVEILTGGIDG